MKCRLIASSEDELREMIDILCCLKFHVTGVTIKKSSHPKYTENNCLAYFDLGVNDERKTG
ncbi:MAG: hypothetical protein RLZZ507_4680 [Cyanobacteriota bacterium]|jgi:hypothetical protein